MNRKPYIAFALASMMLLSPLFAESPRIGSEPLEIARAGASFDVVDTGQSTEVRQWTNNPVHMVVVFTRFQNEFADMTEPPAWSSHIFDGQPGSVNHYFETMTSGNIRVTGEVLPLVLTLPHESSYYGTGSYADEYAIHVLENLDRERNVSFSDFDNDGPDGIPGSADDDGYVDYLVMMPLSQPPDFLSETAIGISILPINEYTSMDLDSTLRNTKADSHSGCIVNGSLEDGSIGLLIHEFIHSFEVPDLYDTSYTNEDEESAGIGFWGVMGNGTMGWDWRGGPVAMSAYTRMLLGAIGVNNDQLKDIYGIHRDIRISDVSKPGGTVYRVWLTNREYYLIEYRRNDGNYYDRDIPANGLLIWHVHEGSYKNNRREELKLVDLECADGRWNDAGYPKGTSANADNGRDNLDFYSKKSWYSDLYAGNLGDATDVFDGVRYTSFGPFTNPDTSTSATGKETGVKIFNIRRDGDDMLFDVETAPFIDWSKLRLPLIGTGYNRFNDVYIINDITDVAPATVYLISYDDAALTSMPDELVAVGSDAIASIDLSETGNGGLQALIEYGVFGMNGTGSSATLSRENIQLDEYRDILDKWGITETVTSGGRVPVQVQRIAVSTTGSARPSTIVLEQNYPNPFNASTMIAFTLPKAQTVRIEVFNVLGQRVVSLDLGYRDAGMQTAQFTPDGLSSGIYLYRIAGETGSETKRLIYLR